MGFSGWGSLVGVLVESCRPPKKVYVQKTGGGFTGMFVVPAYSKEVGQSCALQMVRVASGNVILVVCFLIASGKTTTM